MFAECEKTCKFEIATLTKKHENATESRIYDII